MKQAEHQPAQQNRLSVVEGAAHGCHKPASVGKFLADTGQHAGKKYIQQ